MKALNLLETSYIKKGKNVEITRQKETLIIHNKSSEYATIIMAKLFHCEKKYIHLKVKSQRNSQDCKIKFINRKKQIVAQVELDTDNYITRPARFFLIALRVKPNAQVAISELELEYVDSFDKITNDFFKGETLLICPGYPSEENKYRFGFVHTRVKAYQNIGMNIDVASVNDTKDTTFYTFEGIEVCRTTYLQLRKILQTKHYDRILVHFFNEQYAQILDATDISRTRIYLYCHGGDTIYRDQNRMAVSYFTPVKQITTQQEEQYKKRDNVLKRYNDMPNVTWIFGTQWAKNRSETTNNINYKQCEIIPCFIDETLFQFHPKTEKDRTKIFMLRKFDNVNTYAVDIAVRTILELSRRFCFAELEFHIYGDGTEHDRLLKPLEKFENVHIYKKFLTHEEIAKVHQENGIALFTTRYETQGVSACEAAMSGLVVVSGEVCAVPEVMGKENKTLCEPENYIAYANVIEELYQNPDRFVSLSKKMHERMLEKFSYANTIEKELEMFKQDEKKELPNYPYCEPKEKITLTIAVPAYNVENFLRNSIFSLINNEVSDEIEVLIINDGSKDNTAQIAQELERMTTKKGKSIVKLIDKPNGGHGSTINKGIELAKGKYFKLMDGDDYFDSKALVDLVKLLREETSDIVLNNYVEDKAPECVLNPMRLYQFMIPGWQYNIEDLCFEGYGFTKWGPLLSTSTYRTDLLKQANFKISEKCFYVDMEYNTYGFMNAQTVTYYPLDLYIYYIGREGQSISKESYTKNYKHHETVTLKLIKEFYENPKITPNKREYLKEKIIIPMVEAQYYITTEYLNQKEPFLTLDKEIMKHDELYHIPKIASKRVKFHRKTKGRLIKAMHVYDKIKGILKR